MCMALAVVAEEPIEALFEWFTTRPWAAQSPFPEGSSYVPLLAEKFGESNFLIRNRFLSLRLHLSVVSDPGMARMLARHQYTAGRCTNCIARVVLSQSHTLCGQLIQVRRANPLLPEAAKFTVS